MILEYLLLRCDCLVLSSYFVILYRAVFDLNVRANQYIVSLGSYYACKYLCTPQLWDEKEL